MDINQRIEHILAAARADGNTACEKCINRVRDRLQDCLSNAVTDRDEIRCNDIASKGFAECELGPCAKYK